VRFAELHNNADKRGILAASFDSQQFLQQGKVSKVNIAASFAYSAFGGRVLVCPGRILQLTDLLLSLRFAGFDLVPVAKEEG
jgi:hypothetical protein